MPTDQIIPKYSFPYVEVSITDNTEVVDEPVLANDDLYIKSCYVVRADSGIDRKFIRKNTVSSAKATFGDLNFKVHGQPLLQAYDVLAKTNAAVWFLRVTPDNATYANSIVSAWYKADTESDYTYASERKFRLKFTSRSVENVFEKDTLMKEFGKFDGVSLKDDEGNKYYMDAEGYRQKPIQVFYAAGRGKYGNKESIRISRNINYEKEFGVKLYNYEILKNNNGLVLESNYVGATVTSDKYDEAKPTLIDDIIETYLDGEYPVCIKTNEDNVIDIYNAYITFLKNLHEDLEEEYEDKLSSYGLPDEILDGTDTPTADQLEMLNDLSNVEELIEKTATENLPSYDEFDLYLGKVIDGGEDDMPAIRYVKYLSPDVDITADDYDQNDYTETEITDITSVKGIVLYNGSDGYFDNPRVIDNGDGTTTQWTVDQEVEECYNKAFSGMYDPRILSSKRILVDIWWDANYPFSTKVVMSDLALARDSAPIQLDVGIINSTSSVVLRKLKTQYEIFDNRLQSIDICNYQRRDPTTNKKITVTISDFLAPAYMYHVSTYGYHIPFVKNRAILTGHIRDSLVPVVDDWNVETKQWLYDNRFNYFQCRSENTFERATQSSRQSMNSDLLEENNIRTLYMLKRYIENDIEDQIYNFADASVRNDFVTVERAKYESWVGTRLESLDINFATSEYEFRHSILHLYVNVVFRGLTKICLVEIRINKRTYSDTLALGVQGES